MRPLPPPSAPLPDPVAWSAALTNAAALASALAASFQSLQAELGGGAASPDAAAPLPIVDFPTSPPPQAQPLTAGPSAPAPSVPPASALSENASAASAPLVSSVPFIPSPPPTPPDSAAAGSSPDPAASLASDLTQRAAQLHRAPPASDSLREALTEALALMNEFAESQTASLTEWQEIATGLDSLRAEVATLRSRVNTNRQ